MDDVTNSEVVAEFMGDAHAAAARLSAAFECMGKLTAVAPRLSGEVQFPKVVAYRLRSGLRGTALARFEGVLQERGARTVLSGSVSVTGSARMRSRALTLWTILLGGMAVMLALSTGQAAGVAVGLGFATLCGAYLYAVGRINAANGRAERDLLLRELKEVAQSWSEEC